MSNLENEIKELEEKLLFPEVRHSKKQLSKLLADEFYEIGKSGKVYNKIQVIEAISQEENETSIILFDFEVKELTEGIVLALYKTKYLNEISLRSSIWKKHIKNG